MASSSSTGKSTTLSGREETVRRLVDAATELFAARGPDGVSLREVAAAAGVNYGLIHQYVGSKDDLLDLAMRQVSRHNANAFATDSIDEIVARIVRHPDDPSDYARMITWAVLQGRDPARLLGRSPAMTQLAQLLPQTSSDDQRTAAVAAIALGLGWQLVGELLANGADLDLDEATDGIRAVVHRLLGDEPVSAGRRR